MTSIAAEPTAAPSTAPPPPRIAATHRDPTMTLLALCLGAAITLCVQGYQFGRSNHTVYLLDALHRSDPTILANDWFTTQTFQYHAVFGLLTRGLMRVGLLEPGFLVAYLALVALFHVAWMRIVAALGGDLKTYLVSVLLYYLSAGGTGLGVYEFFQDGSFLPSNVANVAMLWAVYLWIEDRPIGSGASFGVAGIFHLNHAIAGAVFWCALSGPRSLWERVRVRGCELATRFDSDGRSPPPSPEGRGRSGPVLLGSVLALAPCLANIAFAAILGLRHRAGALSLGEFVDLYVRLRHPHHYDPRAWPAALWVAFLWPLPLAVMARQLLCRRTELRPFVRRATHVVLIFAAMNVFALVGAGVFYVSETLVQMSLYRFSIYVQLIACIGAAVVIARSRFAMPTIACAIVAVAVIISMTATGTVAQYVAANRGALTFLCALAAVAAVHSAIVRVTAPGARRFIGVVMISFTALALIVGWSRWTGLALVLDPPDPAYLATCAWAREHTPVDAVFVVPPQETEFRYYARRAIVVNFKGVPQLSSELGAWRDRLRDVLGLPDLATLPRGDFRAAERAIGEVYDGRSAPELFAAAQNCGARYVVATHDLGADPATRDKLVVVIEGRYFLYDLDARGADPRAAPLSRHQS
jgi:hypothetical protein